MNPSTKMLKICIAEYSSKHSLWVNVYSRHSKFHRSVFLFFSLSPYFLTVWFAFLFFCSLGKSSRPSTQLSRSLYLRFVIFRGIFMGNQSVPRAFQTLNRPCLTKIMQWYLTRHLRICVLWSFGCPWNLPLYMNYLISSTLFSELSNFLITTN